MTTRTCQADEEDVSDELGLPISSIQQLQRMETDCQYRVVRAKLVCIAYFIV